MVRNNTNRLIIISKELDIFNKRGYYKGFLHRHTSFHILKIIFIVDTKIKESIFVFFIYLTGWQDI